VRVGIVAFTDNEPGWAAAPNQPGINELAIRSEQPTLQVVAQAAADALRVPRWCSRCTGGRTCGRAHCGTSERLRAMLARGVDVVYGHSAHIFRGVEVAQGKPILYDTGDFLDDYAVDPVLRNDQSLIFFADVDAPRLCALRLVPVHLPFPLIMLRHVRGRGRAGMSPRRP
jgi:Bacterial capsule synthesis protein PGA_cap